MPEELDRIRRAVQRENPGMPEPKAWAIATSAYKKKHGADYIRDKEGTFLQGFRDELQKIAADTQRLKGQPFRVASRERDNRNQTSVSEQIESKSLQAPEMHNREANMPY